jgi:hypothetical protein
VYHFATCKRPLPMPILGPPRAMTGPESASTATPPTSSPPSSPAPAGKASTSGILGAADTRRRHRHLARDRRVRVVGRASAITRCALRLRVVRGLLHGPRRPAVRRSTSYMPGSNGPGSEKPSIDSTFA